MAQQRMEMEAAARVEEEARVAAEQHAIAVAKERALAEANAAELSQSLSLGLMKEKAEAAAIAQDLFDRMTQQSDELDDWRFRAETVLSEAPIPLNANKTAKQIRKVATVLAGLTVFAGVVGFATLNVAAQSGMPANLGLVAVATPLSQSSAAGVKAVPVPAAEFSSKLQMSYVLAALPSAPTDMNTGANAATSKE
ncbi:MAG: hypothetical protein ACXU7H_06005 [Burkholderiaceae bacterium]